MHEFILATESFIAIVPGIKAFLTVTLTQKSVNFQKINLKMGHEISLKIYF